MRRSLQLIAELVEAGGEQVRFAAEPANREAEFPAQFVEVLAAAVLQCDPLELIPDALVGIEVGCIARVLDELEACRPCSEEVSDGLGTVDGRAIPDRQQVAPHLPQKLTEEGDDRRSLNAASWTGVKRRPAGVMALITLRWSWVSGVRSTGV
jgi:hypothetical protein